MTLRERRKVRRMTQESLAEIINIDRSAISKWETGETIPSLVMLIRLSDFYGCTINDLLEEQTIDQKQQEDV